MPGDGRTTRCAIEIVPSFDGKPGRAETLQAGGDLVSGKLMRLKSVRQLPIRDYCDEALIGSGIALKTPSWARISYLAGVRSIGFRPAAA